MQYDKFFGITAFMAVMVMSFAVSSCSLFEDDNESGGNTVKPGLYAKAWPITAADTPIAGIPANDIAAAVTRFNLTGTANDGEYTLLINQDVTLPAQQNLQRANRQLTIIGLDEVRTITGTTEGAFRFNTSNILLTLGENITIKGVAESTASLISVALGSSLTMKAGSKITGFSNSGTTLNWPVSVSSTGTFTMDGGEISGNTVSVSVSSAPTGGVAATAGVFVGASIGNFIMNGGKITGNTLIGGSNNAGGSGGGVYVASSSAAESTTFTMNGGEITGNTRNGDPSDVAISSSGTSVLSDTDNEDRK